MANYKEDIVDIELANGNLHRSFLKHSIGMGDALANRFGVRVFRNREPVQLAGTCTGYFIRADGATIAVTGTIDGSIAYVTLTDTCYAVEGYFCLAIKVTSGGETVTLRIVDGMVSRTSTDIAVDPGTILPSIEDLITAIEEATAQIPADYSGMKRTLASVAEDENGEIYSHIKWELGGINSDTGAETTRTDSVRSQFIPISNGDSIQCIRLDEANKASGWWANAHYYDANMVFLGNVTPGGSQYSSSFMRIPALTYPDVAFVRFSKLTTAGNVMSSHKDIWRSFVRKARIKAFEEKLRTLQNDYDILDMEFTNAGGISAGAPYDIASNSARFRTTKGYPFPAGSKIVIPDNLKCIYNIWVSTYYDAGRYIGLYYEGSDPVPVDGITEEDFEEQDENMYIAIAGQTLGNLTVIADMVTELPRLIKIAVPKKKQLQEERLGGDVSGAANLFDKIPFKYGRTSYYYQTDGNIIKQKSEDTRVWGKANADFSIALKAGTYHLFVKFLDNDGAGTDSVAYKVFNNAGTAIIDYGSRSPSRYDNENTFTLAEDDTISIQWKSYAGNRFAVYLYAESYDTLKVLSGKVRDLAGFTGDEKYTEIYSEPVQTLVRKYDATADAGKIGYIWISDLHVNSLYPDRNKALKRQLMACADIANRTNIQFILIGGDIIDRETSHEVIFSVFNEAFSGVKESRRPVAIILGNHDDNPYTNNVPLTKNQDRALFIDMNTVDMIAPDSVKNYYYFDRLGYRFICLDAIDYPSGYAGDNWWGFSQTQVEWLAGVLRQTTQKTIIFSHITLDDDHNGWGLGNNGEYTKDIRDLIEAYNGRDSITLYGQKYNFSNATGKIMFVHAGHAHFDEQYTKAGMTIPLLVTTCAKNETSMSGLVLVSGNTYEAGGEGNHWNTTGWRCKFWPERVLGTITESAFDVVSVGENIVNVFRVGAGEDRSFTPA